MLEDSGVCARRRGQAILEYAVMLGVVTASVAGVALYTRRGIQAGVRQYADRIGDQVAGMRYETGDKRNKRDLIGVMRERASASEAITDRQIREQITPGGGRRMDIVSDVTTTRGTLRELRPGVPAGPAVPGETSYTESITYVE